MSSPSALTLSLRYGSVVAAVILVFGCVLGYLFAGVPGLLSALGGVILAAAFMALTAVSILVAERVTKGQSSSGMYFLIIIAAWAVKVVVFIGLALVLREQTWFVPGWFFGAVVVAILGSLIADILAFTRARVPYVGDIPLPGDEKR
jgi:hypothetical protein